jgi:hypothetical protein
MNERWTQPIEACDEAQPGLGLGKGGEETMRYRMSRVGVALLAVAAFGAMAVASSAMANEAVCVKVANTGLFMKKSGAGVCEEELAEGKSEFELSEFLLAEWLESGASITQTTLVETTGELLLENTKAPIIGKADVLCSGILVGDIGPDGAGDITEVLNLSKGAISSTSLSGTSLTCTDDENCESGKAWPVGLPWLSLLELWVTETPAESGFVDLLTSPTSTNKVVGWYVECTVLGVKASEECTVAAAAWSATNLTEGIEIDSTDSFTELMGLKLELCSGNKEETGVVEGKGMMSSSCGPLTVSE